MMRADTRVRQTILACGGIRQQDHHDSGLTGRENRRVHGYLDRRDGIGMDEIADILADVAPESGIQDSDDLAEWLQGEQGRDYLAEYESACEPEPDPIEWQYIDQAERMARAMRGAA
jgi:hypothetical protein